MRIREHTNFNPQTGAITILVALFLLVLLTIAALAMSHNALREVIISGTVRQGTEVRNVADNGLEWSCYWLTPDSSGLTKATPDAGAKAFGDVVRELSSNPEYSGVIKPVSATGAVMTRSEADGATRKFSLGVILMGKQQLDLTGGAPSTGAGGMTTAVPTQLLPDIWSIRSTGTLSYGVTGADFQHIREAWVTAPPQSQ